MPNSLPDDSYDCEDTLGGRLAHARDHAGLSLDGVAARMNLQPATLNYWEADRAAPALPVLKRLAAILGVAPMWLLTGSGHGPGRVERAAVAMPLVSRDFSRKVHRTPRNLRA